MRGARVATQPSETGGRGKTSGERAESEVSFFFFTHSRQEGVRTKRKNARGEGEVCRGLQCGERTARVDV